MTELAESNREVALIALNLFRGIERATAEAAASIAAILDEDVSEQPPAVKGAWQSKVARLPGLSLERGMTAGEVAREVEYDEANTYTVLNALEKAELLELIPGSPKRWRLAEKHRRNRILRASRIIAKGEWTTYGDLAIAVSDNVRLARTVARVAAYNPAFLNPHRVLKSGGVIPPDWHDEEDNVDPAECERRLREEGIAFNDDGEAAREAKVSWEELKSRIAKLDDEDDAGLPAAA